MPRILIALKNLPCFEIIILLLGAIMINEFYAHLAFGNFTAEGFSNLINDIIKSSNAPDWWKSILHWMGSHSTIFSILFALITMLGGILLILFI